MTAWPSLVVVMMLSVLPLGCAGRPENYVDPSKYQLHNCAQLEQAIKPLNERAQELKVLYAKATVDSGGAFIAYVTYEAEYQTTVGNIQLIEAAARDRDCHPPITGVHPGPLR